MTAMKNFERGPGNQISHESHAEIKDLIEVATHKCRRMRFRYKAPNYREIVNLWIWAVGRLPDSQLMRFTEALMPEFQRWMDEDGTDARPEEVERQDRERLLEVIRRALSVGACEAPRHAIHTGDRLGNDNRGQHDNLAIEMPGRPKVRRGPKR